MHVKDSVLLILGMLTSSAIAYFPREREACSLEMFPLISQDKYNRIKSSDEVKGTLLAFPSNLFLSAEASPWAGEDIQSFGSWWQRWKLSLGSQPCSMMQWVSPGVWVGRVGSSMHPAWSYTLCEKHPSQIPRERSLMWALDFDKWNTLGYGISFCWISDFISMEQHMESRLDSPPNLIFLMLYKQEAHSPSHCGFQGKCALHMQM